MPRLRAVTTLAPTTATAPAAVSPFWWLRHVPVFLVTVGALWLLYRVGSVAIVPVLASLAFAYILNPVVERIERNGVSRAFAAIGALLLVVLFIVAFCLFVIPDLWRETT